MPALIGREWNWVSNEREIDLHARTHARTDVHAFRSLPYSRASCDQARWSSTQRIVTRHYVNRCERQMSPGAWNTRKFYRRKSQNRAKLRARTGSGLLWKIAFVLNLSLNYPSHARKIQRVAVESVQFTVTYSEHNTSVVHPGYEMLYVTHTHIHTVCRNIWFRQTRWHEIFQHIWGIGSSIHIFPRYRSNLTLIELASNVRWFKNTQAPRSWTLVNTKTREYTT